MIKWQEGTKKRYAAVCNEMGKYKVGDYVNIVTTTYDDYTGGRVPTHDFLCHIEKLTMPSLSLLKTNCYPATMVLKEITQGFTINAMCEYRVSTYGSSGIYWQYGAEGLGHAFYDHHTCPTPISKTTVVALLQSRIEKQQAEKKALEEKREAEKKAMLEAKKERERLELLDQAISEDDISSLVEKLSAEKQ